MGRRKDTRDTAERQRWAARLAAAEGEAAAAAAWLDTGDSVPDLAAWPPLLQVAVVEQVASGPDEARLAALAQAPLAPPAAKAYRRARHRLRSRGIALPELAPTPRSARGREVSPTAAPACLVTDVDVVGVRLLLVACPQGRELVVVEAQDHVREGLRDLRWTTTSRREYRQRVREGLEARGVPHVAVEYATARQLLVAARERARAAGRPGAAQEYAAALLQLPPADAGAAQPGAAEHFAAAELAADRSALTATARLHERPEFQGWILPREAMQQLYLRLQEVAASQLYVNEAQREEQREIAFTRATREFFSGAERELQAARLAGMADFLLFRGDEDDARQALIAARHLADPDADVTENGFARAMVDKLFGEAPVASEPGPSAAGLVLPGGGGEPDPEEGGPDGGGLIVLP